MFLKFLLWVVLLIPAALFPLACGSGSSPSSSNGNSGGNTATAGNTSTVTSTLTPVITSTATVTNSVTKTSTQTTTYTPMATNTQTPTSTYTVTNTQTVTSSQTATNTKTVTNTQTVTNTVTQTPTYTWTTCPTSVVIGDTNTSIAYSFAPQGANYGTFSNFTPTISGTLRDIRVYMSGNSVIQVGIYTNTTTSPTLIVASPSTNVNTGSSFQWVYFYFTGGPTLSSGTTYSICALMTGGSTAPTFAEDASGHNFYEFISNSDDMNTSFGSVAGSYADTLEIAADLCN